ncbi:MAG: three-Cys-motif partner protein TcmP [Betaproteobacteria bacterium]|nr:three-Cys-motif partner protein TcmP [Betaproteobacteria bacterium]
MTRPDLELLQPDPYAAGKILEVGDWSVEKHQLLRRYVDASWAARKKWPKRCFIDLFCGPGRMRIKTSQIETDGGALVAWRQSKVRDAAFTQVFIGDVDHESLLSCKRRLDSLGAPVAAFEGEAVATVDKVVEQLPRSGLHLAYLDPFNMEHLPFAIIEKLASFPNIDIVVHFSVMDLQREIELDFERDAPRFDAFAPGWRENVDVRNLTKQQGRIEFVHYWLKLVQGLGFKHSKEMPLMTNSRNGPLYRMMFLMRHELANKLWSEIARGQKPTPDLFSD